MAVKTKVKTKKAVAARFKITGTGKLVRKRPGRRHILTKKTSKRKRFLKTDALVSKGHSKIFKKALGIG